MVHEAPAKSVAPWMLYGATGVTGGLILAEALRRGHRPLVAGRDAVSVRTLADRHGLEALVFDLLDPIHARQACGRVNLVLHAAGPYGMTGMPIVEACLDTRTSYVDVSGEVPHLLAVGDLDERAQRAGVALLTGAGFGVTFADCLASHMKERLPDATFLRLSISPSNDIRSPAARISMLAALAGGSIEVRNGRFLDTKLARTLWRDPERRDVHYVQARMADVVAAYRTTGIPNILGGVAMPVTAAWILRLGGPIVSMAAKGALRKGSAAKSREPTKTVGIDTPPSISRLCAEASNAAGEKALSFLETGEGYRMAAAAAVRSVERVLRDKLTGSFTPGKAFGADFALELPLTRRIDISKESAS